MFVCVRERMSVCGCLRNMYVVYVCLCVRVCVYICMMCVCERERERHLEVSSDSHGSLSLKGPRRESDGLSLSPSIGRLLSPLRREVLRRSLRYPMHGHKEPCACTRQKKK